MNLIAAFDNIIIEPIIEQENIAGNIIIPDTGKEKNLKGKIISVGPGKYSVTGNFTPTSLKEGQIVLLPQMGPVKIEFEGKEYYGCAENMIIGILTEN